MIIICPWCLLQIVILFVFVLPVLKFLDKVCKIQWAGRAYAWCMARIEALKFWKKKEKEKSACTCEGCEKEEK